MVKRYYIEIGRSNPKISENGYWVEYEDYAKLASLAGRMAVLLQCVPDNGSEYAKVCKEAIAEWEAMK